MSLDAGEAAKLGTPTGANKIIPMKPLWPKEEERGTPGRQKTLRCHHSIPAKHHGKNQSPITSPISKCWMGRLDFYSHLIVPRPLQRLPVGWHQRRLGGDLVKTPTWYWWGLPPPKHQRRPHGDQRLPSPPGITRCCPPPPPPGSEKKRNMQLYVFLLWKYGILGHLNIRRLRKSESIF